MFRTLSVLAVACVCSLIPVSKVKADVVIGGYVTYRPALVAPTPVVVYPLAPVVVTPTPVIVSRPVYAPPTTVIATKVVRVRPARRILVYP